MKPTISFSAIWTIFALLFFSLCLLHVFAAFVSAIELPKRAFDMPGSPVRMDVTIEGSPIDKPLADFVKQFNEASRMANILAAVGYFVAGGTALYSGAYLTGRQPKP